MKTIGSLVILFAGCLTLHTGCTVDSQGSDPEGLGQMTLDLSLAPAAARCAEVTFNPDVGSTLSKRFSLAAQQLAVFNVNSLPTGRVAVSEQVFTVPCNSVKANTAPTWIADPVFVELEPGSPVTITMALRRVRFDGEVTVVSDFPGEGPVIKDLGYFVSDMTIGPDGSLWLASETSLVRITPGGEVRDYLVDEPGWVWNVTASPDGRIWFIDSRQQGVVSLAPEQGMWDKFPIGGSLRDLTAGPDDKLWATDYAQNRIVRITTSGFVDEFELPQPDRGPMGITAGVDGNVWFTEATAKAIGRITPEGAITEFPLPTDVSGEPSSITAGPDGNLWFVGLFDGIGRITPNGELKIFSNPNGGVAITSGIDGTLWYAGSSTSFGSITTAGEVTEYQIPVSDPRGPFSNRDIVVEPNGRISISAFRVLHRVTF
jgi:virginiamycin B lyase